MGRWYRDRCCKKDQNKINKQIWKVISVPSADTFMIRSKEIPPVELNQASNSVIFRQTMSVPFAVLVKMIFYAVINREQTTFRYRSILCYCRGILVMTSVSRFQNIRTVFISIFSSGVCAPLIVGPNEIISIPLNF